MNVNSNGNSNSNNASNTNGVAPGSSHGRPSKRRLNADRDGEKEKLTFPKEESAG